jgi:hypothetical protein
MDANDEVIDLRSSLSCILAKFRQTRNWTARGARACKELKKGPRRAPSVALHLQVRVLAGVPGHFIFGRGRDRSERSHLVPIVEFNGGSWRSNLKFLRKGQRSTCGRLRGVVNVRILSGSGGGGRRSFPRHLFFLSFVFLSCPTSTFTLPQNGPLSRT